MKKIRKMDERELSLVLKSSRINYVVLSLTVLIFWLLSCLDIFEEKEKLFMSIIFLVDALTYLITSLIFNPNKIKNNEK